MLTFGTYTVRNVNNTRAAAAKLTKCTPPSLSLNAAVQYAVVRARWRGMAL